MNDRKLTLGIIIITIMLLAGGAYLLGKSGSSESKSQSIIVASYSISDKEKPRIQTDSTLADLGSMKVSEERSKDFSIKNTGTKPLQLSKIRSSCGCTVGKLIINGKESGEFGMHSQGSEIFEIPPQNSGILRIIYRPYVMPVYGFVEREVFIETNDPSNQNLIFKVTTNVK